MEAQPYSRRQAGALPGIEGHALASDIRAELARVLNSEQLRGSQRLTRFLGYVVEAALSGRSHRIKAYTVAVEALGRDTDFDPQTDSIVRVEAVRLRQALWRYYRGPGCGDDLMIELPRGSYVPCFHRRARESFTVPNGTPLAQPARLNEIAVTGQLSQSLSKLRAIIDIHRLQMEAVAEAIAAARRTLDQSGALLQAAAAIGSYPEAPFVPDQERRVNSSASAKVRAPARRRRSNNRQTDQVHRNRACGNSA